MNLRNAKIDELSVLNEIAFESEAYWGEDENYMNLFAEKYSVTEEMIRSDYVYFMENDKEIVGFFVLLETDNIHELELFYVKRILIGNGYGKLLWSEMCAVCKEKGIEKIVLVGSDDVVNFYKRLGAKEIGKINSSLKVGKIVTKFEYVIK